MTFTRRYLDPAHFISYKALCVFEDKLCIFDRGPNSGDGQVLHTADGKSWSTLFSRTAAEIGPIGSYCGMGMAVYNGSLFITRYASYDNPRVIEWDGSDVIKHLQTGGFGNYMASNLVVWDGKLWCLTDVTPYYGNNRRVVYYYDGTSWTKVIDYDGAEWLDYNRSSYLPEYDIKHRSTRLFVFEDELYLIATRYTGTRWAWEVWKFDATGGAHFTKLYDSDVFNDGYALGAIMEFEGKVKIVGNYLAANGNSGSVGKLYSSANMVNWTEETVFPLFEDEFDDASRNSRWTDEPNSGAITEAGDELTLAVANGVDGEFWGAKKNAPICWVTPGTDKIIIEAKINPYTVNDDTVAGIYITDVISGNAGIHFGRVRDDSTGRDGIGVSYMGWVSVGNLAYQNVTTLPIWLRVVITGSGAGSTMAFYYSTNGIDWGSSIYVRNNETWSKAGLVAWNWGVFNAISAPFEYFHIRNLMGFPCDEVLHEGKFYLNCINEFSIYYTWIRHWEERFGKFTLDQEIATNPAATGGGLAAFNGDIYAGKYKEVYGEPGTARSKLRLRRHSLPLLEMGYKDMLGNKFTERLAPIDTRSPARFYHGRIKQMSSLKRAIDDKTGLFQIADMSVTLANADKHYSRLLASHILKNQEATLYHAWTEEAEWMRLEVIKLIIEDHSMKGPDFTVKLKDITQKYFTMKVPENICTTDNFPFIHPDHEGRCMPEILGNASLVGDYEYQGAVEAVYVNPTGPTFRCLASAGIITIPADQVWIGTAPKTEGTHYNVVYEGGRTYIQFLAGQDPGDESVSFNAHGYSLAAWNSAAGYIQNLAYIIQYYLRYIMGIPASLVNAASFATLAGYYVDMGVHLDSYLILQNREDAMETLRQLLFTGGAKGFMALDGKFNIERKNICNWQIPADHPERHIFEQIELFDSPHRKWNLTSAINTVNAQFGYIPWQNLYTGARSEYRDNRFERPMEGDVPDRWMGKPRRK